MVLPADLRPRAQTGHAKPCLTLPYLFVESKVALRAPGFDRLEEIPPRHLGASQSPSKTAPFQAEFGCTRALSALAVDRHGLRRIAGRLRIL